MYSQVTKAINRTSTALAIALICASAAQANVYEHPRAKPLVSSQHNTPERLGHGLAGTRNNSRWLTALHAIPAATTLRLTRTGLSALAPGLPPAGFAARAAASPSLARDPVITASIPAAAKPAGKTAGSPSRQTARQTTRQAIRDTIRQDRPLFGAHRIRFGKIGSGARISGLIRKAASAGSSAICINRCASLADRLELEGSDISAQLRHVSASVNRMVAYRTDRENHGRLDQWSTPNETLGRASGDCEDYAILKMAILSHLGVPLTAMEIVVVKDTSRRLFHAVLSVALHDRTVILDNMTDAVEADTEKRSYAPLFSLSGTANYIFGYKGGRHNLTASLKNIAAIAPGAGF